MEAHGAGDFGVVGGPVVDFAYSRLRDWVVYFCEYNNYLPPWQEGEEHDLGSANIAYSQAVLLKYKDLLGAGYWEARAASAAEGRWREVPGPRRRWWCTIADLSIRLLLTAKVLVQPRFRGSAQTTAFA